MHIDLIVWQLNSILKYLDAEDSILTHFKIFEKNQIHQIN